MGASENGGTPKLSISIGISIVNNPFWGTPSFGNTHMIFGTFSGRIGEMIQFGWAYFTTYQVKLLAVCFLLQNRRVVNQKFGGGLASLVNSRLFSLEVTARKLF